MKFAQDEKVILENKFPQSRKTLVLTNKRLIIHEKKGSIGERKDNITEISLGQIKEAHGVMDSITKCSGLILDLKDGEQIQFTFEILSGGKVIPEESKKITDNFLKSITCLIEY